MPSQPKTPGARFRAALKDEWPLEVVGTINAYCALLAQRAGFRAIYLSGAGVANASLGVPDLGLTSLNDVCEDIRRITAATDLPLLVDADTGWGGALMIARAVGAMTRAGAAGCHLEDQVQAKRCGHRPGKQLVVSGPAGAGALYACLEPEASHDAAARFVTVLRERIGSAPWVPGAAWSCWPRRRRCSRRSPRPGRSRARP